MTAAIVTTLVLVAGFAAIGWWARRDARKQAQAQHPSSFTPETNAAIEEAVAIGTPTLIDDIELYLKMREPRR